MLNKVNSCFIDYFITKSLADIKFKMFADLQLLYRQQYIISATYLSSCIIIVLHLQQMPMNQFTINLVQRFTIRILKYSTSLIFK